MTPILYNDFFRNMVLRKKQDLVNPVFHGISEISLPKNSLLQYVPKNPAEYGPSNSEAFISNYPAEIYIDFVTDLLQPVMGNGRIATFDLKKAISSYRAGHYNYNWTRDISTVYAKDRVLVVRNYGLIPHRFIYRASLYVNYEKYYNQMLMVMDGINKEAERGDRHQFLRIELPLNLPSFTELFDDYRLLVRGYKDGLPVLSPQVIGSTKAENTYWLLDLLGWLLGQTEFSLFGKISEKALGNLHFIFTYQSKALVLKASLVKEWLDEVGLKPDQEFKTPLLELEGLKSTKRMNVVKRFYLVFLSLTRDLVPEKDIVKEEQVNDGTKGTADSTDSKVDSGKAGEASSGQGKGNGEDGKSAGSGQSTNAGNDSGNILDIFANSEKDSGGLPEAEGSAGAGGVDESAAEWSSEVADELLEVQEGGGEINTSKVAFPTPESGVKLVLDERARDGKLTVSEQDFYMRKGTRYQHIEMPNGQTFAEFIQIPETELNALAEESKIDATFTTVLDESMLSSRATALKNGYAKKFLAKDIAAMALGFQNAGFAMNDYRVENHSSVEGSYNVHSIQYHHVNGDQVTIHPRFPVVEDDGSFIIDSVKQHFQLQRKEKVFRKISSWEVALTTYYDRKLMITRSRKVVDDLEKFMVKQIALQSKVKKYTFNKGGKFDRSYKAPRIYSMLAKQYKSITVGDTVLDFNLPALLEKHPGFKKYTKQERFLIGVQGDEPLTIDDYGNLYQGETNKGTVEDLLGIDLTKAPLEHALINISGYQFPLGVVLCYYFGIDELLKVIKATTRSVPIGTRLKLDPDEFAIKFNDQYLVMSRREKLTTMIFGGMPKLTNISNFSRTDLNNNSIWTALMGDPRVRPAQFQEMKNLYTLFLDPIAREELRKEKLPDSFHYLLIEAAKVLGTDYSRHEVEIEEQRLVGYERFAGLFYREMCKANRQFQNKGITRRHKLDFNPDAVIIAIGEDNSGQQVEEVGPVHQVKDQEEVTFGGTGGRNEITVVKRARTQLVSYQGIISEANKDSGKVGFVTYTSSDPAILDYRGNIDLNKERTPCGDGSVTMNLMYGGRHDDAKRAVFTSTQWSQAISASNYGIVSLRTGYENVLPHRTSELYSKVAKANGTVTEVKDDELVITYDDKSVDRYPLGLYIGEASGEYHRHTRVTDMKVGQTFKKGDVVGWDNNWFMRDIFCPGQVGLKGGFQVRVGLFEDQDTYEDSIAISSRIANETLIPYIKPTPFTMKITDNLVLKVKVGDEIEQDSILCDIEEPHLVEGNHDASFVAEVNKLGIKQVKSTHHGKIVDIRVQYNGALENMTESVRQFVTKANKLTKRKNQIVGKDVETNAVSGIFNVNRPSIQPDTLLVIFFVESQDGRTRADKFVFGNQLKATAGRIMTKKMFTEDRQEIDAKTSFKAPFNRMVISFRNRLIVNEWSFQFTKRAIAVYRGN
jgi:hypothetical protein